MRSKEVDLAIHRLYNAQNNVWEATLYNKEQQEKDIFITIDYIKQLEAKLEFKQFGDLDNAEFENLYVSKDKIRDIKEECKKEGCCSDKLKEYYDNECVRICKYYEVCTRVDKLLEGE